VERLYVSGFYCGLAASTVTHDTTFHHLECNLEIISERNLRGAARSIGVTFYRTEHFNEIEVQLWWIVVYVSRPRRI
jgi:hypothetical protein